MSAVVRAPVVVGVARPGRAALHTAAGDTGATRLGATDAGTAPPGATQSGATPSGAVESGATRAGVGAPTPWPAWGVCAWTLAQRFLAANALHLQQHRLLTESAARRRHRYNRYVTTGLSVITTLFW